MKEDNYSTRFSAEELFPTSWYENVTNATNYVLSKMDLPEEHVEDVISHIIEYNINKQIHDKLLNSITDDLPCYLSLVDTPATKVFNEFKSILDACDVCPSFKEHVLYIQMYNFERDKKLILFWKELAEKEFQTIRISTREMKKQECMKLTIRKI